MTTQSSKYVKFLANGDTGLTVEFGDTIDRELSQYILNLRSIIEQVDLPGVTDMVPTYRSLLIHYDPLRTSQSVIIEALQPYLVTPERNESTPSTHWKIPICFEGDEFAPDLPYVSHWAKLPVNEVIDIMTSARLYVYMIGFAPGQPYMGDLPKSLAIPRRENPLANVPSGSLVIATGLAVLYPIDNPTGWYVVGQSPIHLFNPDVNDPVLLRPGDSISLIAVDRSDYGSIASDIADGSYTLEKEIVQ